ncbi:hypothetical protein ACLBW0_10900 [Enterobacteriaceae bacterium C34A]
MLKNQFIAHILGLVIISLMLCFSFQNAFASDKLPKGKDYPVNNIYNGKPAEHLDKSDEFTNTYRTRFKEAIQGNIVFAGEYSQAEWGCGGSGCHVIAFINKRTGRALAHSFMAYDAGDDQNPKIIGEEIVYISKESTLIVTLETDESSDIKNYNYYSLDKKSNSLQLIKKIQSQPK